MFIPFGNLKLLSHLLYDHPIEIILIIDLLLGIEYIFYVTIEYLLFNSPHHLPNSVRIPYGVKHEFLYLKWILKSYSTCLRTFQIELNLQSTFFTILHLHFDCSDVFKIVLYDIPSEIGVSNLLVFTLSR